MTTPGGVPNLPIGALTVETLASRLQDQTAAAMRARAGEQMPTIFGASNGGDIMSDLSPFGILTNIWASINSLIANSDPNDIQGPDDLPPLFTEFIENLPVIGQFVELLEALSGNYTGDDPTLNSIQDLLAPVLALVGNISEGLQQFLGWLWEQFGPAVDTFLKPVAEFLHWLWIGAPGGFDGLGEQVDAILKPLVEWLTWLWTEFGASVDTFLKPVTEFLHWLWAGVTGGFTGFGGMVDTVLKPAFEFLQWLFGTAFTGAIDTLKNIFLGFQTVTDAAGGIQSWLNQIPLIGPLVSSITQRSPLDGVSLDLSALGAWAREVLTQNTDLPAANLKGSIPGALLSSIPIANINIDSLNLLSQGDFATAGSIEAANGWEWDGSVKHPDSGSGGSVKVTANGTLRELFSNQTIKVVAGDRINLSAYVKTSGFSGSGSSIVLSLIPFVGTQRYTVGGSPVTIDFDARGASSGWVQMIGKTNSTPVTAPWTVPATVTSVRVRLAVTAAATAGTVWFDDIDLHKTGLLGQSLVEYLTAAWENFWNGLVGTSGTGKTWADMFDAANFLRNLQAGTAGTLSTLGTNLKDAPAAVLGSLFSVLFDGTKTVGDFLKLLYNALGGNTTTTPNSTDVATAAADTRSKATTAAQDASDAKDAADLAKNGVNYLKTSLLTGYSVATFNSSGTWTKPDNLAEVYVVLFGAGGSGANGGTYTTTGGTLTTPVYGGTGGVAGNVVATQVDLSLLSSLSSVTVTVGTYASPVTYFGSIVSSAEAFANYVATPLGLMPSASLPTAGGNGGSSNPSTNYNIVATAAANTLAGIAGGSAGTSTVVSSGAGTYTGGSGGAGTQGRTFNTITQTGASGGGGGGLCLLYASYTNAITAIGGAGGSGSFPGGGGGGGGAAVNINNGTAIAGAGGLGGHGAAIIVYKIAKTTA